MTRILKLTLELHSISATKIMPFANADQDIDEAIKKKTVAKNTLQIRDLSGVPNKVSLFDQQ